MAVIVVIVLLILITYFVIDYKKTKKNPNRLMANYEDEANKIFETLKSSIAKDIEGDYREFHSDNKPFMMTKQELKRKIENKEKELEMENMYIRLKERFKHDQTMQHKLVRDWCDYVMTLNRIETLLKIMEHGDGDDVDESLEKSKSLHIQKEEIEKRFSELLEKQIVTNS